MIDQQSVSGAAKAVAQASRSWIPAGLLNVSGRALYSPASTLVGGSPYYFMGLNPGEVPGATESHSMLTVDRDLDRLERDQIDQHGYLDESWKGYAPGTAPIQVAGQQVFAILAGGAAAGIELFRRTPVSNVVLYRSTSEQALEKLTGKRGYELALEYWPFHRAVIAQTRCTIIITHAIGIARQLAKAWGLGTGQVRPSGWGGTLASLYAWRLKEGPMLLAMPNLSRYKPDGPREGALRAFFQEFADVQSPAGTEL